MKNKAIFVNVCLNENVLKTISIFPSTQKDLYSFNNLNPGNHFPDSDRLYLEDINGMRYKRVFPETNIVNWFYFKQI